MVQVAQGEEGHWIAALHSAGSVEEIFVAAALGAVEPSAWPRRPATVFRSVPAARSRVAE
jgi:hypothetical protein